jgi:hypothetical protein
MYCSRQFGKCLRNTSYPLIVGHTCLAAVLRPRQLG